MFDPERIWQANELVNENIDAAVASLADALHPARYLSTEMADGRYFVIEEALNLLASLVADEPVRPERVVE